MTVGRAIKKSPQFEFIYDFGDYWSHQIIFEDIFDVDPLERYPVCIAGESAPPPEDCGGIDGFEDFKKSTKLVKKRKSKNVLDSLDPWRNPTGFDPHYFDLRYINEIRLKRRKVNSTPQK